MRRILFVPLYDNHIRVFLPVIKQLQAQNALEPLVIVLERVHTTGLVRFLDEHNLPYMKVDIFPTSFKGGRRLNVRTLTMRAMEKHILSLFYTRRKIKELFDTLNPAFVITVNESYYADRFFLQEAKKRGIPSLSLFSVLPAHVSQPPPLKVGFIKKLFWAIHSLWRRFLPSLLYLYRRILIAFGIPLYYIGVPSKGQAAKVCVWNEFVKQEFVKSGGIPEKIVVTGSPASDIIYHKDSYFGQKTINRIYELLNIEKDKEIILFTSQAFARDGVCTFGEQKGLTEFVIETCAKFDGYFLVIKLHPAEIAEDYSYISGHPLQGKFRLVTDEDAQLYDLIYASRLVITQSSTTGIDAILFDKEVININLIIKDQEDYAEHAATLSVCDKSRLFDALDKVLNNKNVQEELRGGRKRFIAEYLPEFDGKATDRVIYLIFQLLKNDCLGDMQ